MKTVKLTELKDHLSQRLRAVEAGEEIVVTDRRRPIARIVPVTSASGGVVILEPRHDFAEVRDRRRVSARWAMGSTDLLLEERRDR